MFGLMSELSDLYQEVILDHNRRPRNFRVIDPATATQEGYNPLCGDRFDALSRRSRTASIEDVGVPGLGLRDLEGVGVADDRRREGQDGDRGAALFERFHQMITSTARQPAAGAGQVAVLAGVREFPTRVKCAGAGVAHAQGRRFRTGRGPVTTE